MQNRLKELRKAKKLSQKEFAKAFNEFIEENKEHAVLDNKGKIKKISQATVSRWEVGQTPIPTKYYEALTQYFRVSLAYFISEHFNEFADTLTNLPPKVAELAMSAAYSVISAYEANQNEKTEHSIKGGKHGNR